MATPIDHLSQVLVPCLLSILWPFIEPQAWVIAIEGLYYIRMLALPILEWDTLLIGAVFLTMSVDPDLVYEQVSERPRLQQESIVTSNKHKDTLHVHAADVVSASASSRQPDLVRRSEMQPKEETTIAVAPHRSSTLSLRPQGPTEKKKGLVYRIMHPIRLWRTRRRDSTAAPETIKAMTLKVMTLTVRDR